MRRPIFLSTFLLAAALSPVGLPGSCQPPTTASLAVLELRVGDFHGENVIDGFDPNVFLYDVRFPESESVAVLWVRTKHPSQSIEVEYDGMPVKLVGQSVSRLDVPLGSSELTIDVATRGPASDSQTYVVRIQRVPVFPCTEQGIREAIARGGGPIFFDCDGPTTVMTEAEIVIDNDVILDGEGKLIVDAGGGGGGTGGAGGAGLVHAEIAPKVNGAHRVFSIPEGVTAELIGFTVTGGSNVEAGGGIQNLGTLTLADSTVSGNTARFGGGVENEGQVDVIDTVVSDNYATQANGGITNRPGATMTLTGATVQGNIAAGNVGGIGNTSGTLTLNDTTVSGNEAAGEAGGVRNSGDGTLIVTQSTVSGNTATSDGGGILNWGTFTLNSSVVSGNSADRGGGVASFPPGTLTVVASTVSGNHAAAQGGGIHSIGPLEVTGSSISGNSAGQGGGILSSALTLIDSSVSANTADFNDGGIHIAGGGIANLQGSTITENSAQVLSGGIGVAGQVTMSNCMVSGNSASSGGGIGSGGIVTLSDSVILGNTATEEGGGIRNEPPGSLIVTRSTVTQNTAGTWGGGIRNFGAANIMETTLSNNSAQGGGGISNRPGAWLALANSTLSANQSNEISNWSTLSLANVTVSGNGISNNEGGWITARNTIVDSYCNATPLVESLGGNIESEGNTCGFSQPTDLVNVPTGALNLGPLADNGGPTATHALLPGSVAIDLVPLEDCLDADGEPLLTDQRGIARPQGPECDSGAFEFGGGPQPGGQCVNDADRAVYEMLEYIDDNGDPSICIDAAAAISADCVFGSAQSQPPLVGCGAEAGAVIACYPTCPQATIAAFADCVANCTADATLAIVGTGLSAGCASCYAEDVACSVAFCLPYCVAGAYSPPCIQCRIDNGCIPTFDACSGLPDDIDCSGTGGSGGTGGTGGTGGMGGTGGTGGVPSALYEQDFESLQQTSPTVLSDDGWLVSGTVFDSGGTFKFDYGPFGAPNLVGAFCDIDIGQGGLPQGNQQLVVYSDYGCCQPSSGHFPLGSGTDQVESSVFQEPYPDNPGEQLPAAAIGKTLEFSFDAKRGNINSPSDPSGRCDPLSPDYTTNPPCDSKALAYVETVDPNAGFAQTNLVTVDMTNIPATWGRYTISLDLSDPLLEGQVVRLGFRSIANGFEPSAIFYDNILVVLEAP